MKTERVRSKVKGKQLSTFNSITCGEGNPSSLKCVFYDLENGEVATFFTPDNIHEGHTGIMHGGLSASVLDEVMGRANLHRTASEGEWLPKYVTAEMTTKYLKPILIGNKMFAYGRVTDVNGRCCFASAEITDEFGEIMATAQGVYVKVDQLKDLIPSEEYIKKTALLTKEDPKEL